MASSTSRIEVFRGRPPGYTGMRGWTRAHCSSVRSLGYRGVRIPHRTRQTTPYRTDSDFDEVVHGRCQFANGLAVTGHRSQQPAHLAPGRRRLDPRGAEDVGGAVDPTEGRVDRRP